MSKQNPEDANHIAKLNEYDLRLSESADKSQNVQDYEGIIELSMTSINTKLLGTQLIPRYFHFFVSLPNDLAVKAFNTYMDILEEADVRASDANHVDNVISCLQATLPFFVGGAPVSKLFHFLTKHIMPDFYTLTDESKLDLRGLLRALVEISPHTPAQEASQMIPPIVHLLKRYMHVMNASEDIYLTYTEGLLYIFHQLAHKVAINISCGYNTLTTQPDENWECVSNWYKEFIDSLTSRESQIKEKMKKLAERMSELDMLILDAQTNVEKLNLITERQETKTGVRACNNILSMIEVLYANVPSFIGDSSIKLSWEKTKKPLASNRFRISMVDLAPELSDEDHPIGEELVEQLFHLGICELNEEQVIALVGLIKFQQAQDGREEGPFTLTDNNYVAALCWQKEQKEFFRFVSGMSYKEISGPIRDQLYHMLCWAYVASDLVSGMRILSKWENDYFPLCTWYLCAFCEPERLRQGSGVGKGHKCYKNTIEDGLLHIQTHGIPRDFMNKIHSSC